MNNNEYKDYKLDSIFIVSCTDENGRTKRGTCFSISNELVVTAWHVVKSMKTISLYLSSDDAQNNKSMLLEIVDKDEAQDIAILKIIDYKFDHHIEVSTTICNKGTIVNACGYPIEKGNKHCTLDTKITENFSTIETDHLSFEIEQNNKVSNYRGMSGTPILVNKCAVGILLVQQGGTSLYSISFSDAFRKNSTLINYFISEKTCEDPSAVLFYRYTEQNESFYIERKEDRLFGKSILLNNIWVSGNSGSGKTALINRNLLIGKISHCYIDFSAVTVKCKEDVLNEIFLSVCEKFDEEDFEQSNNIIKDTAKLIEKIGVSQIVVVIDELSINSEELLKEVSDGLMQLVNHISNYCCDNKLKFSVSTISPPSDLLTNASKAQEFFYFIDCNSWSDNLGELFDILCDNLCLNIGYAKLLIIKNAKNSPRILKSIFREIVLLDLVNINGIESAIYKALGEVVTHD
ncbi:trypsin-like peptidase domain-containing protein [Vibrio anguillarum]|uniref:trypsin-like peptidase domain-containing protein n=1 Tax=Vibrio anguillarum TaxID=55601 RepID=UPI0009808521|nr:trypsin-like peptidase domain-containing protein [Vibrio anguillarum]AQP35721.1 hypothetical protein AA909_04960 [Vibrio anguillarum]